MAELLVLCEHPFAKKKNAINYKTFVYLYKQYVYLYVVNVVFK